MQPRASTTQKKTSSVPTGALLRKRRGNDVHSTAGHDHEDRQEEQQHDERREVFLQARRQPQPGEEAQHDAGKSRHHFHHRLHVGAVGAGA